MVSRCFVTYSNHPVTMCCASVITFRIMQIGLIYLLFLVTHLSIFAHKPCGTSSCGETLAMPIPGIVLATCADIGTDQWKLNLKGAESRIEKGKRAYEETLQKKQRAEAEVQQHSARDGARGASVISKDRSGSHQEGLSVGSGVDLYHENQRRQAENEMGCWSSVLEQLQTLTLESCETLGESTRALMALARTKCHFLKAERHFPNEKDHQCILNIHVLSIQQVLDLLNEGEGNEYVYSQNDKYCESQPFLLSNENLVFEKDRNKSTRERIQPQAVSNEELQEKEAPLSTYPPLTVGHHHVKIGCNPCLKLKLLAENRIRRSQNHAFDSSDQLHRDIHLCNTLKYKMVNRCTRQAVMSDTAFQIYHNDLNHIDDICFYLESAAWNQKTERNINRLSQSASLAAIHMENSIESMTKLEELQKKQAERSTMFEHWLKEVKSDFYDIFKMLSNMKDFQVFVADFIYGFKSTLSFIAFSVLALIFTIPEATNGARTKLFFLVFLNGIIEIFMNKWKIYYSIDSVEWVTSSEASKEQLQAIRWCFIFIGSFIWLRTLITYRPPIQEVRAKVDKIAFMIEEERKREALKSPSDTEHNNPQLERLKDWMNYIQHLDEDSERWDPNYCLNATQSEAYPSTNSSLSSAEESGDEEIGQDTLQLIKEAKQNLKYPFCNSASTTATVSSRNRELRRNPHRQARPHAYDSIPILGKGKLLLEHPNEFARRVEEQSYLWRKQHEEALRYLNTTQD